MNHLFALLTGILISLMITLNGELAQAYGLHSGALFVHIVGLGVISMIVLFRKERPFAKRFPWFYYIGGAIGVASVFFTNFPFGRISVSAILALGLLGQSMMSILVDQWGLFGMPQHDFPKRKLAGFSLLLAGIIAMTTELHVLALFFSFMAGVTIVIARTINAKLSDSTSVAIGTFFNFFIGLITAFALFAIFGRGEVGITQVVQFSSFVPIYLGGAVGVCVVLLSNYTVSKVPAFYLSLLLFIGQVFAGIVIDILLTGAFSGRNLIGGVFVAGGLVLNLLLDRRAEKE